MGGLATAKHSCLSEPAFCAHHTNTGDRIDVNYINSPRSNLRQSLNRPPSVVQLSADQITDKECPTSAETLPRRATHSPQRIPLHFDPRHSVEHSLSASNTIVKRHC